MIIDDMVATAVATIKQELERFAREAEQDLTAELAERATRAVQQAVCAAGRAAFRTFIESKETAAERVVVDGEEFRFKYVSSKSLLTLWGKEAFRRRGQRVDARGGGGQAGPAGRAARAEPSPVREHRLPQRHGGGAQLLRGGAARRPNAAASGQRL